MPPRNSDYYSAVVARLERSYDVSSAVSAPGRHEVAATIIAPDRVGAPVVLCCIPGGGTTGGYFDLTAPDRSYSFAEHAAAAGMVVVVIDNLGTGRSRSTAGLRVTPLDAAVAGAHAFAEAAREIPGPPRMVAVGHSMGAALAVLAQDRRHPFDALALLGFTAAGLPDRAPDLPALATGPGRFGPEVVEAALTHLGRTGGPPFPFLVDGDTPAAARRAYATVATPVLPGPALLSILPGALAALTAAVDVPVFIGVGDHEPWAEPAVLAAQFAASPAVDVHVLERAAHNHVLASTRHVQWERLCRWAAAIAGRRRS